VQTCALPISHTHTHTHTHTLFFSSLSLSLSFSISLSLLTHLSGENYILSFLPDDVRCVCVCVCVCVCERERKRERDSICMHVCDRQYLSANVIMNEWMTLLISLERERERERDGVVRSWVKESKSGLQICIRVLGQQ